MVVTWSLFLAVFSPRFTFAPLTATRLRAQRFCHLEIPARYAAAHTHRRALRHRERETLLRHRYVAQKNLREARHGATKTYWRRNLI